LVQILKEGFHGHAGAFEHRCAAQDIGFTGGEFPFHNWEGSRVTPSRKDRREAVRRRSVRAASGLYPPCLYFARHGIDLARPDFQRETDNSATRSLVLIYGHHDPSSLPP